MTAPVRLEVGDMREVLPRLRAEGVLVDSVVTDPPYHLDMRGSSAKPKTARQFNRLHRRFTGKTWDSSSGRQVSFESETWRLCLDLLRPGGHALVFNGTRGYHRMACAVEDAGFEVRDAIAWLYGSGFPKSLNVSVAVDRELGQEPKVVGTRPGSDVAGKYTPSGEWGFGPSSPVTEPTTPEAEKWVGWGTGFKPAMELVVVARKPLAEKTVARNVLAHGTGAINIDGCRIRLAEDRPAAGAACAAVDEQAPGAEQVDRLGRWPANVTHDGSGDVLVGFPETGRSGISADYGTRPSLGIYGKFPPGTGQLMGFEDSGSAARFFYSAKAGWEDRVGTDQTRRTDDRSRHPTVKPVDLMRWLVRIVTPPGGTVLDPFAGTGSTGEAAWLEGMRAVLVERDEEYVSDIRRRLARLSGEDLPILGGQT